MTPRFFGSTAKTPDRIEVVLTGIGTGPVSPGREYVGTVSQIGSGGESPLAPGSVVLSGGGTAAEFLRAHARLDSRLAFRLDVDAIAAEQQTSSGAAAAAAGSAAPRWDAAGVRAAVAGGPRLLTAGRITVTNREEGFAPAFAATRHPRTAVGVTGEGVLLLVTVDGRQKTLSRGATLAELAALLLRLGRAMRSTSMAVARPRWRSVMRW
jgi:hypothetical protein